MNAKPTQPATYAEASSASAGTDPLVAKIKAVESHAIERSRQRQRQATQESLPLSPEALPSQPPPAKVVMLPIWPDAVRAVPNGMLRSALFGAIRRGSRRYMERELRAQFGFEGTAVQLWFIEKSDRHKHGNSPTKTERSAVQRKIIRNKTPRTK